MVEAHTPAAHQYLVLQSGFGSHCPITLLPTRQGPYCPVQLQHVYVYGHIYQAS